MATALKLEQVTPAALKREVVEQLEKLESIDTLEGFNEALPILQKNFQAHLGELKKACAIRVKKA